MTLMGSGNRRGCNKLLIFMFGKTIAPDPDQQFPVCKWGVLYCWLEMYPFARTMVFQAL